MSVLPRSAEGLKAALLAKRVITETGCWEFNGYRNNGGYGNISVGARPCAAHRLAALLYLGWPLHSRLLVLHACDNRACFNPAHLFRGTQRDNMRDMLAKGRHGTKGRRKSLCPRGHSREFLSGRWFCRECGRANARRYQQRRRNASKGTQCTELTRAEWQ